MINKKKEKEFLNEYDFFIGFGDSNSEITSMRKVSRDNKGISSDELVKKIAILVASICDKNEKQKKIYALISDAITLGLKLEAIGEIIIKKEK